jgi:hypothetical protein
MSSYRNRRVRAQRKRHSRTVAQLKDRIRTFEEQGRKKEAKTVETKLMAILLGAVSVVQVRAHTKRVTLKDGTTKDVPVRPYTTKHTYHHKIGEQLGITPTSPVLEKQDPKVHGVNVQRETRSRPKVGGAGRKNGP